MFLWSYRNTVLNQSACVFALGYFLNCFKFLIDCGQLLYLVLLWVIVVVVDVMMVAGCDLLFYGCCGSCRHCYCYPCCTRCGHCGSCVLFSAVVVLLILLLFM